MEIEDECRGALFKRLSEKIDSANDDGHRLGDSFAPATLGAGLGRIHFCTCVLVISSERITLSRAWVESEDGSPFSQGFLQILRESRRHNSHDDRTSGAWRRV